MLASGLAPLASSCNTLAGTRRGYFLLTQLQSAANNRAPRPCLVNQHRASYNARKSKDAGINYRRGLVHSPKGGARNLCPRAKVGVQQCGENTGPASSDWRLPLGAREHLVIRNTPLRDPGRGSGRVCCVLQPELSLPARVNRQQLQGDMRLPPPSGATEGCVTFRKRFKVTHPSGSGRH